MLVFFSRAPTEGDNLILVGTSYVVEKRSSENNDVCELSAASQTRGNLGLDSIFVLKGISHILLFNSK